VDEVFAMGATSDEDLAARVLASLLFSFWSADLSIS
jgi:hypothetical protein